MRTLKGPFKIVTKEMALTFYINAGITLALFALYFLLNTQADSNEYLGVLFGPFYVVFLIYPFILFKSYKFILSLGGTRKQFILSAFIVSLIFMVVAVLLLNGLNLMSQLMFQNGHLFHIADILTDANTAMYFWIDFLWLFILFGIGMFSQVIYFNLGTVRTLSLAALLILGAVTAFFFIDLTPLFEFIVMEHVVFIHLLALASLVLLVLSYFMMRNAPLERGGRKLFKIN